MEKSGKNPFKPSSKKEMVSRTFHIDVEQLDAMQKVSKKLGISQSEMVRRSIYHFVDEFSKRSQKK